MDQVSYKSQCDSKKDSACQTGKPELMNGNHKSEAFSNRLLNRKMNEEMLHYSARERCGY